MNKIEAVKKEVRHREWAEQVRECQSSGLAIKEWCKQNCKHPKRTHLPPRSRIQ